MNKKILWTILLSTFLLFAVQPSYGSILVGRITHVEGKILTYSEDEEDWVEVGTNAPVGAEDGFYTDKGTRAELVFPNDTMLRMGEMTEVEVLRIEEESTEVYIRTGIVRAYSRGSDTVMKVGTAMGYVEIPPQGTADFHVDDRSTEIVALEEDILFHKTVGPGAPEIHELRAGSNSLIFSVRYVETGRVLADSSWNRWCLDRDIILKEQTAIRSAHLPSSLQVYSHELEPYGEWERMKYRSHYYWFWRPVRVSIGWTPFTRGRWNRWHREYVWVSTEPWGWCTHHYGNWVNLHGAWRWTPYIHIGVSFPGISLVNFNVHFGKLFRPHWHPGRIAWVSTTSHVGWIPLAPWETYYGYRNWGPRTVVVKYKDRPKRRTPIYRYAYRNHSVFVPQNKFRRVNPNRQHDYRKLMVTGIKKKALLRDSKPTFGRHKMARVQQDAHKKRWNDRDERQRTITKPNAFRSPSPSMGVFKGRAHLKPEKKTTLPRKKTKEKIVEVTKRLPRVSSSPKSKANNSPQVSTVHPPLKPSAKQEHLTRQNLKQTKLEQSARKSSTLPRTQQVKRNTKPSRNGQSVMSQPVKDSQKWASQQSRQKQGAKDRNNTPVRVSKGRESLKPEKKTILPRKKTGERIAEVTKRRPRVSSSPKSRTNNSPQVSTARPPQKPSVKQDYPKRQNLKQTRPEQSPRQSSNVPRAQHVKKKTEPSRNGKSVMSQPSKNPQKWASQQSRQKLRDMGSNTLKRQWRK